MIKVIAGLRFQEKFKSLYLLIKFKIMVTIVGYKTAQNEMGEEFYMLVLQGKIEMVKSKETGSYYATARKALITSTFTEEVCESLIGTQMDGEIVKEQCDPYEYTVKETGEIIELSHSYRYLPKEEANHAITKQTNPIASIEQSFSENGVLEMA